MPDKKALPVTNKIEVPPVYTPFDEEHAKSLMNDIPALVKYITEHHKKYNWAFYKYLQDNNLHSCGSGKFQTEEEFQEMRREFAKWHPLTEQSLLGDNEETIWF